MHGMNHSTASQAPLVAQPIGASPTVIVVGSGVGGKPARKLSKSELPFYESPLSTPTSSQIIKEAKQKLSEPTSKLKRAGTTAGASGNLSRHESQENVQNGASAGAGGSGGGGGTGLIRTLSSNRPFTPREEKRTLFGPKSTRAVHERPPSSFQIGSKSFETDINSSITFSSSSMNTSRPLSATRLSPISVEKKPSSASAATKTRSSGANEAAESDPLNRSMESLNSYLYLEALNSPKLIKCRLAPLPLEKTTNGAKTRPDDAAAAAARRLKNGSVGGKSSASSSASSTDKHRQEATAADGVAAVGSRLSAVSISEKDEQAQTAAWTSAVEPLLARIERCYRENLPDEFSSLVARLNKLLEANEMYSKTFAKRSLLLKTIFKYLDAENDRMRVYLSQIILNMKVSGNNLTNICRLLFSISRNTENDVHFQDNDILDSILNAARRLDFKENSDSVIYYCGTLKNLSENARLLKQLSGKNLEEILARLVRDLSKHFKDNQTLKSEAGHALVQLTATLRNLADLPNTRPKFLGLNLIEHLVYILKYYTSDGELMLNVSRILSKLTLHADCCQELARHDSCYKSFIKLLIKHDSKQDLVVRVAFILGNLTSRHEEARLKYFGEKYAVETLINTLRVHLSNANASESSSTASLEPPDAGASPGAAAEPSESEDVVVKLIRVVANLALNEQVGAALADRQDLVELLIHILDAKTLTRSEELVLDSIITINNLSFYDSSLIVNYSQKLVDSLMKYLLSNDNDAILEVFRVFANLSRHKTIRAYLVLRKVNALAIAYLSSSNKEILFIVIGVLINFMSDPENRPALRQERGVGKLIEILNEVGASDWQLSAMICKVLMNYSESGSGVRPAAKLSSYFDAEEAELLRLILAELLSMDPRLVKPRVDAEADPDEEENIDEYIHYLWTQDFSPVASLLLKRLNEERGN